MILSKEFNISINELISGEKIKDSEYKEKAESNLIAVLENSSFTLKEKIDFYKKKWLKEHIFSNIMSFIFWLVFMIILKFQNINSYILGSISGIFVVFLYTIKYNQMMIYVEEKVYKKKKK